MYIGAVSYYYPEVLHLYPILAIFYVGVFCSNIGATIVGPIFPEEAERFGINQFTIGVLMGLHPCFSVLSAFWMGRFMAIIGRSRLMMIGSALQGAGYIMLGFVGMVPDNDIGFFIALSICGEILSGIGATLYIVPCLAIVPMLFKSNYYRIISYIETLTGLGLGVGYILASVLSSVGGYLLPFCVMAVIVFCLIPFTYFYVPDNRKLRYHSKMMSLIHSPSSQISEYNDGYAIQANNTKSYLELSEIDNSYISYLRQSVPYEFSYLKLFKDSRIPLTYLVNIMPTMVLLFLEPTYSLFLRDTLGVKREHAGYFFGVTSFTYVITCPLVGCGQSRISKRLILATGLFLFSLQLVFQGPAGWMGLEASVPYQFAVQGVSGVASALIFIVAMPEFMDLVRDIYPVEELNDDGISDIASALYNSSYHFGEILGPIIGSLFTQLSSFYYTSTYFGYAIFLLACIYSIRYIIPWFVYRKNTKAYNSLSYFIEERGSATSSIFQTDFDPTNDTAVPTNPYKKVKKYLIVEEYDYEIETPYVKKSDEC